MEYKYVMKFSPSEGEKYYIFKKYNFILFRFWFPVIIFTIPFIFRLFFISQKKAEEYIFSKNKILNMIDSSIRFHSAKSNVLKMT